MYTDARRFPGATRKMAALRLIIDCMKVKRNPAANAEDMRGSVTRRKVVNSPAARSAEASSMLTSIW